MPSLHALGLKQAFVGTRAKGEERRDAQRLIEMGFEPEKVIMAILQERWCGTFAVASICRKCVLFFIVIIIISPCFFKGNRSLLDENRGLKQVSNGGWEWGCGVL